MVWAKTQDGREELWIFMLRLEEVWADLHRLAVYLCMACAGIRDNELAVYNHIGGE